MTGPLVGTAPAPPRAPRESPWAFGPTRRVDAGERSVPLAETYARVRRIARQVPISRVVDLTPLDDLGLPAYAAVTPLARDLKVHNGKGATAEAARVSALMEAVERVSAEGTALPTVVGSYRDLARNGPWPAVDPVAFDLPLDSTYRPDSTFTWVAGRDLLQRRDVLVPVDLVVNPPVEGILRDVDTNGLASGNNHLEAVIHAICEVVERDALSQVVFAAAFGDPGEQPRAEAIELATLPAPALEWVTRIDRAGLELTVLDVSSDVGVPTFYASLLDRQYPAPGGDRGPRRFYGLGTHPDAAVAVFRALAEAIQSRLILIQAARDSYNWLRATRRATATPGAPGARVAPPRPQSFHAVRSFRSADLLEDLEHLLGCLASAGVEQCIAVDLTHPAWAIPVVRVRIPGLSSYYVNRRRPGPRCFRHLL